MNAPLPIPMPLSVAAAAVMTRGVYQNDYFLPHLRRITRPAQPSPRRSAHFAHREHVPCPAFLVQAINESVADTIPTSGLHFVRLRLCVFFVACQITFGGLLVDGGDGRGGITVRQSGDLAKRDNQRACF